MTVTSLITFGVTIYKFFQLEHGGGQPDHRLIGPREFALSMIGIGLVSLLPATREHQRNMQVLRAQSPDMPRSLAGVIAAVIAIAGALALPALIFRQ
jgi:uncharacterized membrane protein YidH (DUF202 family)